MLTLLATLLPCLAQAAQETRVACLGDSITHGARIPSRERNAYPAQLGYLLGEGFEVRNFGVGGATLLRRADRPYMHQEAFQQVLEWRPDVVLCVLGTNDSVERGRGNWRFAGELERDAVALVSALEDANPSVRILLGSPPPVFPEGQGEERAADLAERSPRLEVVARAVQAVCRTRANVEYVELSTSLRAHHVTDGVHPTPFGAAALAERFHRALGPHPGYAPATWPRPSAEYRGHAAGWGGGTWWDQLDHLRDLAAVHARTPIVFLGDSITQGLTGSEDRLARPGGARAIDRHFGELGAISLGLSGDRTEHLLHRIEHGALARMEPELVVLQIGINNINSAGHTGEETARGLTAVVASLREHEPQARIVVCGPFPAGATREDPRRLEIDRVHAEAARLSEDRNVDHLDLRSLFLDEEGRANARMAGDHLHITEEGKTAWMEALSAHVARAAPLPGEPR